MKKKTIFLIIIILLLIVGGVFWWWSEKERKEEEKWRVQWSGKDDYLIEKTSKGKIIKNEKVGFSFIIPEGWQIKEDEESLDEVRYGINLLSPDAEFDNNSFLIGGCGIGITVIYDLAGFGNTNAEIDSVRESPRESRYKTVITYKETIEIDDYLGLKITRKIDNPEGLKKLGEIIEIRVPLNDKGVIYFGTQFLPEYREKCSQEFDKFLETVSIG